MIHVIHNIAHYCHPDPIILMRNSQTDKYTDLFFLFYRTNFWNYTELCSFISIFIGKYWILFMNIDFTEIRKKDLIIIRDIYNYYVLNSTATFHTECINIKELSDTVPVNHPKYKSFLITSNNEICGYCYYGPFRKKQAYQRTAEITIYLKPEFTCKGIGKQVLDKLEALAAQNGIHVLIGSASAENISSIQLFEKSGYKRCAFYKEVGEKFNRILDVVSYQKIF